MSRYTTRVLTLVLVLILSGALVPAAGANSPLSVVPPTPDPQLPTSRSQPVRLLSSTATGVTFEVAVPWENLGIEPVREDGRDYVGVSLPGWSTTSQPGAPALPFLAETIGAPFGVEVTLRIVRGEAHILALPAPVLPVAAPVVAWNPPADGVPSLPLPSFSNKEDAAVYGSNTAYPGVLARVANDGILRQQRVVGIAAYPVQYDARGQKLTVYESLRVEVSFVGEAAVLGRAAAVESAVYEELLREKVLNYEAARAWRQLMAPTGGEGAGAEIQALPWAPPVPGWRITVREDGFYKLSYAELLAAGVPVDSSPRLSTSTFQLYNLGNEVAIEVDDVNADGYFDTADALIFYGQAVTSKYTWDNVYWLTYGKASGLRMTTRDGTPGQRESPLHYDTTRHLEQNAIYYTNAPGADHLDRYLWDYSYPPDKPNSTYSFSLAAPYASGTATLRIAMLGALNYQISPDHHTQVYLNGGAQPVEDAWWDGLVWRVAEIQFDQSLLLVGQNTIELRCPNDTGAGVDAVYVDWIELDFANTFLAEGDELPFSYDSTGTWKFQVQGFSTDQVAVYDVTNPAAVERVEGVTAPSAASTYTAQFQDAVDAATSYWAMARTAYRLVEANATDPDIPSIKQDTASNLQSRDNGADYIIITHRDFVDQAEALRAFRGTFMRAVLVDVRDVYDEFSYGLEGAAPIHDFLAYAYQYWVKPAPSYVVLVGDGHYDPKNYEGNGRVSYMPPYLAPVDPWIGETAADNRYVTVDGADTLPDMMMGRLAVNSAAEAATIVSKIEAYAIPEEGDWRQQVLAVADNRDSGGYFAQLSNDLLACCLPSGITAEKVYYGPSLTTDPLATHLTKEAARAAIVAGINAGKLIVNYIGHASVTAWAHEPLFRASDVAGLTNGPKLPVMLPMTCYDGFYHYPFLAAGSHATAEVITRAAGKGAVASWSPTGLGVSHGHDYLNKGFFDAVFQDADGEVSLGQATIAGKLALSATGANLDLLDTYLLFGDPATLLALPYPTSVALLWFKARGEQDAITLGWETASESNMLGFNLYRAESPDGSKTKLNAAIIPTKAPPGSIVGAVYDYRDEAVVEGVRYYYWLEVVTTSGQGEMLGPEAAQLVGDWHVRLPVLLRGQPR